MPICTVDSNLPGLFANSRATAALRSPLAAACSSLVLRADTTAISTMAKIPLSITKPMIIRISVAIIFINSKFKNSKLTIFKNCSYFLLFSKNDFNSVDASFSKTPFVTFVLGCKTREPKSVYPRFSSAGRGLRPGGGVTDAISHSGARPTGPRRARMKGANNLKRHTSASNARVKNLRSKLQVASNAQDSTPARAGEREKRRQHQKENGPLQTPAPRLFQPPLMSSRK